MDVQPRHCWRCEKVLPQRPFPCIRCPMAAYCNLDCAFRDRARHGVVECKIFGRRTCNSCGEIAAKMGECAQCNNAWYCDKRCQRRDWPTHKISCKEVVATIKSLATELDERWSWGYDHHDVYFGNNIPKDFLKLAHNEWSEEGPDEKELTRDFHILSVDCGDLRSTVLTVASLPDKYKGKLHITLGCPFDDSIMARNVLFLFMSVRFADTDYIASSLTTIWYSLHICKREYDLIKTSLDELIQMSAQHLHDATNGLVRIVDKDLKAMCKVWEEWLSLECHQDHANSINRRQRRQDAINNCTQQRYKQQYLGLLSHDHKEQMDKWLDSALFLPNETEEVSVEFDNPTLNKKYTTVDVFSLMYERISFPVGAWDYLRVKESTRECTTGPCSSLMVIYHSYVTNLLQKFQSFISHGRLFVHCSLAYYVDYCKHHQANGLPKYDRIFTSNLADHGFSKVLKCLKPLLNASNRYSVIVTEAWNWLSFFPTGDACQKLSTTELRKCLYAYLLDGDESEISAKRSTVTNRHLIEYCNSLSQFLQYLRADIMGGESTDVPTFQTVKKCHGLEMRDFRKGLNKLVPFIHRVNARIPTELNGRERAVEWCLPQSDD